MVTVTGNDMFGFFWASLVRVEVSCMLKAPGRLMDRRLLLSACPACSGREQENRHGDKKESIHKNSGETKKPRMH